jgi:hypothetical protein
VGYGVGNGVAVGVGVGVGNGVGAIVSACASRICWSLFPTSEALCCSSGISTGAVVKSRELAGAVEMAWAGAVTKGLF